MGKPIYPNSLAAYMKRAGMTDPKLAELVESNKQTIFKLRKGERKLTAQWAQRLAPHLGVAWQLLLQDPDSESDPRLGEVIVNFGSATEMGRELILAGSRHAPKRGAQ